MRYELDDLDLDLLRKCKVAADGDATSGLDEDDVREAVQLLIKLSPRMESPAWPFRTHYVAGTGYVVWRDVFDGGRRCSLDAAAKAHRVAVFDTESEAEDYAEYRNAFCPGSVSGPEPEEARGG